MTEEIFILWKEKKRRRRLKLISVIVMAICPMIFVIYKVNKSYS